MQQVSVTLAAGVILKALHQRANFYAAAVYLSQSSANLMVSIQRSLVTCFSDIVARSTGFIYS
jgi:hypothetical protein